MADVRSILYRFVSTIVLLVFVFTSVAGVDVAWALEQIRSKSLTKGFRIHKSDITRQGFQDEKKNKDWPLHASRLDELVERIESELKGQVLFDSQKRKELEKLRDELDGMDREIREMFKQARNSLVLKGLSGKTLKRHDEFVEGYGRNSEELRGNLQSILDEKADDKLEGYVKRALKHIKAIKPPRRPPLDPTALPHRSAKPTKKKPRLKKHEFLN